MIQWHWRCHLVLLSPRVLLEHSSHQHRTGLQISVWVWGTSLALSFVTKKASFNTNASRISYTKIWWPSQQQSICACVRGDDQDTLSWMTTDAQYLLASLSKVTLCRPLNSAVSGWVLFCQQENYCAVLRLLHSPAVPRAPQSFCQADG